MLRPRWHREAVMHNTPTPNPFSVNQMLPPGMALCPVAGLSAEQLAIAQIITLAAYEQARLLHETLAMLNRRFEPSQN